MKPPFRYEKTDFVLFGSWIDAPGTHKDEPCMVLGGKQFNRRRAWVIPLSNTHSYVDPHTGGPTWYLVDTSTKICELLGLGNTRNDAFRVASAIVDALPDLLLMPPFPGKTQAQVERAMERDRLHVKINGQSVIDAR